MGIPISSLFCNVGECKNKLRDIIFTNFFYYSLIYDYNEDERVVIEEYCKRFLSEELGGYIDNNLWEIIWNELIAELELERSDENLFI